jgi:hypothetical protein
MIGQLPQRSEPFAQHLARFSDHHEGARIDRLDEPLEDADLDA